MIASYKDKRTERFARGERIKAFEAFEITAERKLAALNEATSLKDLRRVPGNNLEALSKERIGQHSLRINRKWRICFVWNSQESCAEQVEITDYH